MHHLRVLRYDSCVTRGSHSFTCHPHTNHTCLYSPVARCHRPLARTHCTKNLRCMLKLLWQPILELWLCYKIFTDALQLWRQWCLVAAEAVRQCCPVAVEALMPCGCGGSEALMTCGCGDSDALRLWKHWCPAAAGQWCPVAAEALMPCGCGGSEALMPCGCRDDHISGIALTVNHRLTLLVNHLWTQLPTRARSPLHLPTRARSPLHLPTRARSPLHLPTRARSPLHLCLGKTSYTFLHCLDAAGSQKPAWLVTTVPDGALYSCWRHCRTWPIPFCWSWTPVHPSLCTKNLRSTCILSCHTSCLKLTYRSLVDGD